MKVYRTDEIRNVVLLGHGGSGKTSPHLAIRLLLKRKDQSCRGHGICIRGNKPNGKDCRWQHDQ